MTSLLHLYNTLSRQAEPLVPKEPGRVKMYCCGPTVYDLPHVGHARAAMAPDVLARWLEVKGLTVTYVRNLTDVDDKILKRSSETGEPPLQLSDRMAKVYQEQMAELGCLAPSQEPKVSEHLPHIIALIEKLVENGSAYVVDMPKGGRDVYFSVRSFAEYGKLSRRKIEDLRVGARVAADENKKDPLDFALWKAAGEDELGWESPFGRGRPGWHIECSAMSVAYLGHGFDIHTGGMDLIFPHHENEIAQSEAACPGSGPMARVWLHNGFVNADKEKMSKSLGNFVTVQDVFDRNDPEAFRWFLLTVHYRGPIQFETQSLPDGRVIFPGIEEAEGRIDYLYETRARLEALKGNTLDQRAKPSTKELVSIDEGMRRAWRDFESALDDDLNTSAALAALGEMAKLINELCDLSSRRKKDEKLALEAKALADDLWQILDRSLRALGLLRSSFEDYRARTKTRRLARKGLEPREIEDRVEARKAARQARDFAQADALRKELLEQGIELLDAPEGTLWWVRPERAV